MPKKLQLIIIFSFSIFLSAFSTPVSADFNQAYQDYVYNQQLYKNAYNQFQISRSTYLTYKTLTSQNDAISKFKTVLKARNQLISTYYDLLQEKLNASPGIPNDYKNTFSGIRQSEKTWLSENQTTIDSAGSLEDLNEASQNFATKYPQMNLETKMAVGTILLTKEDQLRNSLNQQIGSFSAILGRIRSDGEDTSTKERGLIVIQDKLNFQEQKTTLARNIFTGNDRYNYNKSIELPAGQKALVEANQYLMEAASNLLELVRSFTG